VSDFFDCISKQLHFKKLEYLQHALYFKGDDAHCRL